MRTEPDLIFEGDGGSKLYLGNLGAANNKAALKKCGVNIVIQVSGEDTEPRFPGDFEYHCMTFGDTFTA